MTTDYRREAHRLVELGVSILPLRADGGKRPSILWKEFQQRLLTTQEVEKYFKETTGIAAITGNISKMFLFDFDLNKALPQQDYWSEFMSQVPPELKAKFLCNQTRSGGYHIWCRTNYEDKSRKIARRFLTVPETMDRYEEALKNGGDPLQASMSILNKPLECVIESRSSGSYGVLLHPSYTRVSGETFQEFSEDEIKYLLEICYSLDCEFTSLRRFSGETADNYAIIRQFNEDTDALEVVRMLESSGVYTYASEDYQGNIRLKRSGSSNPYSGRVFIDSGVFFTFSSDTLFGSDRSSHTPFEVYCAVNSYTEQEAVNELKQLKL